MFPLSPTLWVYAGVAVVIAALGTAVKVQTDRLDAVKQEYANFKAEVKALGEAAQKVADKQAADDKSKKEKADAYNKRTVADLAATVKRLRDERANTDIVPPAAPGSRSPEIASFDRAELVGAVRDFDAEVQSLVAEGSKAVIDLDTAKEWAK